MSSNPQSLKDLPDQVKAAILLAAGTGAGAACAAYPASSVSYLNEAIDIIVKRLVEHACKQ
jgi:hypothetical protein